MEIFYTVYKVTNKLNGKFYIGTHKTRQLDDNYMGSGKYLKRAIEKNGIENFTKEILFIYDNPEQMYAKEAEIVNEDFLAEENTYNLRVGGFGGWDYINNNLTEEEIRLRNKLGYSANKKNMLCSEKNKKAGKKVFDEKLGIFSKGNSFEGRKHSKQSKKLISEKIKKRLSNPKNNPSYGKCWITDGEKSKMIKKCSNIPEGWYKGRVI